MKILLSLICLSVPLVASESLVWTQRFTLIEKQLIMREIQRRGKEAVCTEINTKRQSVWKLETINDNDDETITRHYCEKSMVLNIKEFLLKSDSEKDIFTKSVFDKIESIEKQLGYCPDKLGATDIPTNFLGWFTTYHWITEEDIVVDFDYRQDKDALLTLIAELQND
jgi:hypothetical protein